MANGTGTEAVFKKVQYRNEEIMYSYFKGELAEILPGAVILEVNQIGYEIQMQEKMLAQQPAPGSQVQIFTYLNVR